MDRKLIGIGIGAVLVVSLIAIIGFTFAQEQRPTVATPGFIDADNDGVCDNAGNCPYASEAGGFVDTNDDGLCDNAANCPMHNANGGCHGTGGCTGHASGFVGRCHGTTTATE